MAQYNTKFCFDLNLTSPQIDFLRALMHSHQDSAQPFSLNDLLNVIEHEKAVSFTQLSNLNVSVDDSIDQFVPAAELIETNIDDHLINEPFEPENDSVITLSYHRPTRQWSLDGSEGLPAYMLDSLSATLEAYDLDTVYLINFASTCDRPATDGFGGGVVAVSRNGCQSVSSVETEPLATLLLNAPEAGSGAHEAVAAILNDMLLGKTAQERQELLGAFASCILTAA